MLQIGSTCLLHVSNYVSSSNHFKEENDTKSNIATNVVGTLIVIGRVIAAKPHLEDETRILFYFHTISITPDIYSENKLTEKTCNCTHNNQNGIKEDVLENIDKNQNEEQDCNYNINITTTTNISNINNNDSSSNSNYNASSPACRTRNQRWTSNTNATSTTRLLESISTRGNDAAGRNDFTLNENNNQHFTSSEGYVYRFDGWYDEEDLEVINNLQNISRSNNIIKSESKYDDDDSDNNNCNSSSNTINITEGVNNSISNKENTVHGKVELSVSSDNVNTNIPDAWMEMMYKDNGPCEIIYLCYRFKPWFRSPFEALRYLSNPCHHACYSVYICHRCFTPFYSEPHLQCHLEGYCTQYSLSPPGELIYHDVENDRKVFYVDGALHLHYVRCLSLLGRCFIESKLLHNDVDIYELFVLTIPRRALPFVGLPTFHCHTSEEQNDKVALSTPFAKDEKAHGQDITTASSCKYNAYESEDAFHELASSFDALHWNGDVVAGYVSRIKHAPNHTLSCILVLPCFQRYKLGTFLLDLAYSLTFERQRQCGCEWYCGKHGGKISRPFSPSGEALLLRYWRKKLQTLLWRRAEQGLSNEFDGIDDLCNTLSFHAIHKDDIIFLLMNDHIAFYAHHEKSVVNRVVTLVFDEATLLSDLYEMHNSENTYCHKKDDNNSNNINSDCNNVTEKTFNNGIWNARFQTKWMKKNDKGGLVYSKELFHYHADNAITEHESKASC